METFLILYAQDTSIFTTRKCVMPLDPSKFELKVVINSWQITEVLVPERQLENFQPLFLDTPAKVDQLVTNAYISAFRRLVSTSFR